MKLRALLALAILASNAATVARAGPPADIDELDPVRFSYEDAIVERHLVTARDGITALAVDLIRPDTDEPVPAILFQSPYYNTAGRGWKHEFKTPWGEPSFVQGPVTPFPEWYDEYFVPRGYAVVMQDQRGTRNSSGCQVYGGREEITDAVDVIEWIADRPWSNGAVGMSGGSYDGTIAIGAASMAPEPLKAIIPIRAIDRWYDYHFYNGVQSTAHALTPWSFTTVEPLIDLQNSSGEDLLWGPHVVERKACAVSLGPTVAAQYDLPYQDARSAFWASRDFLKDAAAFRAATFLIHGLEDDNVRTTNAGHLWQSLPGGLPKKLWWLRGGHDDPANPGLDFPLQERFVTATHRWFAQFLKRIDTGILDEPAVSIQAEDGAWSGEEEWPPPAPDRVLHFTPDGLSDSPVPGTMTYGDALLGSSRITLFSEPLERDLRIAGQVVLRLRYALAGGGDTTFVAQLSDAFEGPIATGHARAAYRDDIAARGPSWPTLPVPSLPGAVDELSFPFAYQDYLVRAGHHLELTLSGLGTAGDVTLFLDGATALILPDAPARAPESL